MSLQSILNKLSLEEIEELSKSFKNQEKSFFGNELKDSKHRSLIAKTFGLKNWNTLVGLKRKKSIKKYRCPECNSENFYLKIDGYDYFSLDEDGNQKKSEFVNHYDDRIYTCLDCEHEVESILITYELTLKGFVDDGSKDDLVLWINIYNHQDYSFEKICKENNNIISYSKIPLQNDKKSVDLEIDVFDSNDLDKFEELIKNKLNN